jgi:ATP-dependent exoDNAse (exonuclease V) alpha subunit
VDRRGVYFFMLQKEAFQILKEGHNVFLTGCAGSGKTYVLNRYIDFLRRKRVVMAVTASTGIAATHIGGVTLHSFTGMGIIDDLNKASLRSILNKKYLENKIKKAQVLIIDEISMLSGNHLDIADRIMRAFRDDDRPFGGVQVVLCGDFFQLPPIFRSENLYSTGINFAYKSGVWDELDLKICYLTEQHRHEEDGLLSVLNAIRTDSINEDVLSLLNSRSRAEVEGDIDITKLYTHNVNVDFINNKELEKINGKKKVFHMQGRGHRRVVEALERNLLVPKKLEIKEGSVVMFVKNNFEKGYVNGTMGKVVKIKNGFPLVKTTKGRIIEARPMKWRIEEEGEFKAEVEQLPLRLAWAITIHKSQGTTLDAAEIDLSKSFEPGMGYVALSRIRSLSGLRLMGLNDVALQVNKEVVEADKDFQEASKKEAKKVVLEKDD